MTLYEETTPKSQKRLLIEKRCEIMRNDEGVGLARFSLSISRPRNPLIKSHFQAKKAKT